MREFIYHVPVQGAKLLDELLVAIPACRPVEGPSGLLVAQCAVSFTTTVCTITVPDEVAQSAVDAVVAAHNPHTPPIRTLAERRAAKAAIVRERAVKEAT